jgi:hypothetical protein
MTSEKVKLKKTKFECRGESPSRRMGKRVSEKERFGKFAGSGRGGDSEKREKARKRATRGRAKNRPPFFFLGE